MFPKLLELGGYTIHAYGFFIVLGAFLGYSYLSRAALREYGIEPDKISSLMLWIFIAAFVGGKVLFYLEDPGIYLDRPELLFKNIGSGFVFFGSLLFAVPTTIWFFRKERWNVWGMLDLLAFTTLIVHGVGRLGCFFAGCCHGIPTDAWFGVTFSDPACQAEPLNTPLHPTQLYEFFALALIFALLHMVKKSRKFEGQIFLLYVVLYATARSIIEVFRGDEARGFIIGDWFSHSQFISTLLALVAVVFYVRRCQRALPS